MKLLDNWLRFQNRRRFKQLCLTVTPNHGTETLTLYLKQLDLFDEAAELLNDDKLARAVAQHRAEIEERDNG